MSNEFFGGLGNDDLRGRGDVDVLYGEEGNDYLRGQNGNDILNGGLGLDVYIGGNDADTFVFEGETAFDGNVDRIDDFNQTQNDAIDISDILSDYGFDDLVDTLSDWVTVTTDSVDSFIAIDRDGTGSTYASQTIVETNNKVLDTNIDNLVSNGDVII